MFKSRTLGLLLASSLLIPLSGCGGSQASFESNLKDAAKASEGRKEVKAEASKPGARRASPGSTGKMADDDTF